MDVVIRHVTGGVWVICPVTVYRPLPERFERLALIYDIVVHSDSMSLGDIQEVAITGTYTLIQLRYTYLSQKCMNVGYYRNDGAAFLTADMTGVLEAYWNDIKALIRGLASSSLVVNSFDSLYGEEIGGGGSYAEYAVPTAERAGTLAAGDDGEWVSGIMGAGAKLVVGTHATRPGQKRLPFVREGDIVGNAFTSTAVAKFDAVFPIWSAARGLGAPVATGVLTPVIGGTRVGGVPTVWQEIVGHLTNTDITSQVSRKKGRGA